MKAKQFSDASRFYDDISEDICNRFDDWIWKQKKFKVFREEVIDLIKKVKEKYPDIDPEILNALLHHTVDCMFATPQYNFAATIFNFLSEEGYFPCNPKECPSCGQSCKKE